MRAMILAAGRGERMRPLTDNIPKPLLPVGGKPLIVWHLESLARAGFREVVINYAHLGEQFPAVLGSGARWGMDIAWSPETSALETAGGIARALPLLGNEPFLVINGDVFCDWNPAILAAGKGALKAETLAHLVLTHNPPQHPSGDFVLTQNGRIRNPAGKTTARALTFSGIGLYASALFTKLDPNRPAKLAPLLRAAADQGSVSGECHAGIWHDVGTPERLRELDAWLWERHQESFSTPKV